MKLLRMAHLCKLLMVYHGHGSYRSTVSGSGTPAGGRSGPSDQLLKTNLRPAVNGRQTHVSTPNTELRHNLLAIRHVCYWAPACLNRLIATLERAPTNGLQGKEPLMVHRQANTGWVKEMLPIFKCRYLAKFS